jgi:hypothetical protein
MNPEQAGKGYVGEVYAELWMGALRAAADEGYEIWSVGNGAALECDTIARFAVSVVWRSGVSSRRPRVELGPYEPARPTC